MAKAMSFAEKVAKSASKKGHTCPTCGQPIATVKLVYSERSPIKDSWKFNQRFVAVCKCNEKEIYG